MKKTLMVLSLVISLLIPNVANAQKVVCKVKGSDTWCYYADGKEIETE